MPALDKVLRDIPNILLGSHPSLPIKPGKINRPGKGSEV